MVESYGAFATIVLRLAHPDHQATIREELFQRMVFNILMGNIDDHERNHGLRLGFDGYQALIVGASVLESMLGNALSELSEFSIKKPRIAELIRQVTRTVYQWPQHFARNGVCQADMDLPHASIDRDALELQRMMYD